MPDLHHYLLFLAAGLLLNITPGADMLYVVTAAVRDGTSRGFAAALGVFASTLVHITLAVAGLSAMLAASAFAFTAVKWIGAVYLLYLGLMLLRTRAHPAGEPAPGGASAEPCSPLAVFRRGALVNILNPKIALFFLALLPQFVDPGTPHRALALAVLGLSFNVTGTLVNCLAATLGAGVGRLPWVRALGALARRAVGAVFTALGLRLALAPHRR